MASMYAVYHGPAGIKAISGRMHTLTQILDLELQALGYKEMNTHYFDTLKIAVNKEQQAAIKVLAEAAEMNFYYPNEDSIQITINETVDINAVADIVNVFAKNKNSRLDFFAFLPQLKCPYK